MGLSLFLLMKLVVYLRQALMSSFFISEMGLLWQDIFLSIFVILHTMCMNLTKVSSAARNWLCLGKWYQTQRTLEMFPQQYIFQISGRIFCILGVSTYSHSLRVQTRSFVVVKLGRMEYQASSVQTILSRLAWTTTFSFLVSFLIVLLMILLQEQLQQMKKQMRVQNTFQSQPLFCNEERWSMRRLKSFQGWGLLWKQSFIICELTHSLSWDCFCPDAESSFDIFQNLVFLYYCCSFIPEGFDRTIWIFCLIYECYFEFSSSTRISTFSSKDMPQKCLSQNQTSFVLGNWLPHSPLFSLKQTHSMTSLVKRTRGFFEQFLQVSQRCFMVMTGSKRWRQERVRYLDGVASSWEQNRMELRQWPAWKVSMPALCSIYCLSGQFLNYIKFQQILRIQALSLSLSILSISASTSSEQLTKKLSMCDSYIQNSPFFYLALQSCQKASLQSASQFQRP